MRTSADTIFIVLFSLSFFLIGTLSLYTSFSHKNCCEDIVWPLWFLGLTQYLISFLVTFIGTRTNSYEEYPVISIFALITIGAHIVLCFTIVINNYLPKLKQCRVNCQTTFVIAQFVLLMEFCVFIIAIFLGCIFDKKTTKIGKVN